MAQAAFWGDYAELPQHGMSQVARGVLKWAMFSIPYPEENKIGKQPGLEASQKVVAVELYKVKGSEYLFRTYFAHKNSL